MSSRQPRNRNPLTDSENATPKLKGKKKSKNQQSKPLGELSSNTPAGLPEIPVNISELGCLTLDNEPVELAVETTDNGTQTEQLAYEDKHVKTQTPVEQYRMCTEGTLHEYLEEKFKDPKDELLLSKWSRGDDQFMSIASLAALRSKDPRTPVGACIVDAFNKVVGIGYNSMPYIQTSKEKTVLLDTQSDGQTIVKPTDTQSDVTSNKETDDNDDIFPWSSGKRDSIGRSNQRDGTTKHPYVCHAAMNAIVRKTIPDLTNCTIYLTQHPDEDCANIIVQSGIKEVKYQRNTDRGNKTYERNAKRIFQLYAVSIKEYNPKTEVSMDLIRDKTRNLPSLSLSGRIKKANSLKSLPTEPAHPDDYITWEEFFMGLALLEHVYSNDGDKAPTVKVGACLVNSSKQVLAIGGSSASEDLGMLGGETPLNKKSDSILTGDLYAHHAEYKAIASYKGVKEVKGCTLYVTLSPCNICAKLIAQSRITEVFYKDPIVNQTTFDLSKTIFNKCNIKCQQLGCVKKVNIRKTEVPKPFPLEWKKSTVFECTHFRKGLDNWYYYSLNLTDASLKDDYENEYLIDTLVISSSGDITEGDIEVEPCRYNENNKYDKIGKLKAKGAGKRTRITRDYPETVVETDRPICRVKEKILNMAIYCISFDIFIRRKKSKKYQCKNFKMDTSNPDWLNFSIPNVDVTSKTYFFESVEIFSRAEIKTGDIEVAENVDDQVWSAIDASEMSRAYQNNITLRIPIGIKVLTDTPLCRIQKDAVSKLIDIDDKSLLFKDDSEISFNIIVKKKQDDLIKINS